MRYVFVLKIKFLLFSNWGSLSDEGCALQNNFFDPGWSKLWLCKQLCSAVLGALVSWCPVFHACILEDIEIIYEKIYVMLGDMFHVTLHNIEAREPCKSLVAIFRNTALGPQLAEVSLRWLFLQLCRLWSSYSHAENSGPSWARAKLDYFTELSSARLEP